MAAKFSVLLVRRDHLNAWLGHLLTKLITVVGSLAGQSLRLLWDNALIESCFDKGDFMRVSRRRVDGDSKISAVCHGHDFGTFYE